MHRPSLSLPAGEPDCPSRSSLLESAAAFETLISDLSARFVNVPPGELDRVIEVALQRVCESLGLDLATLWQWSDAVPGVLLFTHAYRAPATPQTAEPTGQEQYPWVIAQVRAGRTVTIPSVDELPAEAAVDQVNGRAAGIKSALAVPLAVAGEPPVGAMGLNTLRAERDWPVALVKRPGVLVLKFPGYVKPGDALPLTFDSAVKSLRQLDVSTYLDTPDSPVTLRIGMQALPDGTRHAESVVLGMPASQIEVRITNSSYQKLVP